MEGWLKRPAESPISRCMAFCSSCGARLPSPARFCPSCGGEIAKYDDAENRSAEVPAGSVAVQVKVDSLAMLGARKLRAAAQSGTQSVRLFLVFVVLVVLGLMSFVVWHYTHHHQVCSVTTSSAPVSGSLWGTQTETCHQVSG